MRLRIQVFSDAVVKSLTTRVVAFVVWSLTCKVAALVAPLNTMSLALSPIVTPPVKVDAPVTPKVVPTVAPFVTTALFNVDTPLDDKVVNGILLSILKTRNPFRFFAGINGNNNCN